MEAISIQEDSLRTCDLIDILNHNGLDLESIRKNIGCPRDVWWVFMQPLEICCLKEWRYNHFVDALFDLCEANGIKLG